MDESSATAVAPSDRMALLTRAMWSRFDGEIPGVSDIVHRHCETYFRRGLFPQEQITTTSYQDALFLYLLVRHFDRRNVFEVGTNIGTTAVAMNDAVQQNGGVVTTTDPVDYDGLSPWSGIRFIKGPAGVGLSVLKSEGRRIDFCFFDWLPDDDTLRVLGEILEPSAILATHDYCSHNAKGEQTVAATIRTGLCEGREWIFPGSTPNIMPDGTQVNAITAVCIPHDLLAGAVTE
jgi:hypothetical protein